MNSQEVDVAIGDGPGSEHPDNQGNGSEGPGSNGEGDVYDLDYGYYLTKAVTAGDTERVYISPPSGVSISSILVNGVNELGSAIQDGQDYYLDIVIPGGPNYLEEIFVDYSL